LRPLGDSLAVELEGEEALRAALTRALAEGATIESVAPKRETLEDLFVRRAL
jgi:ABC-2 type transport system ATP-binding protein